jgi:hypothetical protein
MRLNVTIKVRNDQKKMSKTKEPLNLVTTSLEDPFIAEFMKEMEKEFQDPIEDCSITLKMDDC